MPAAPAYAQFIAPEDSPAFVKWSYYLATVSLRVFEVRRPLYHFVTNLCAIIGGVFTMVSLLDTVLHASLKVGDDDGSSAA